MRNTLVVLLLAVLTAMAGCSKKSEPGAGGGSSGGEIVIGEYGSMTGENAAFGQSSHNGTMLAIDEINAKGGVLGKQVRIIIEDNQSRSEQVTTVVKKLINQDKVIAILGEVASARSMAGSAVCEAAGIPMVSPSSTNPDVTVDPRTGLTKPYTFRVCFIDPFQGTVMARFTRDYLKFDKVAILRDVKQDYSVGLANYYTKEFTANGGTIVRDDSYQGGDTDFRAQLTSLKSVNPQAIFVPGYYNDAGNICRQARSLGLNMPILGGDGWSHPSLMELGGDAVQGAYISDHFSAEDTTAMIQTFVQAYQKRFNEMPSGLAACAYDAALILCDAIQRAGNTQPAAIRDALAATKNFKGTTGNISINEQHNAVKSVTIVQVTGNAFKYVTTIAP